LKQNAVIQSVLQIFKHRKILLATVRVELAKRYAGSFLGSLWLILYPVLFLCIYLFLYLVVFRVKFPGYSSLDYVIYVFSGLVPYLGFMEAVNFGTTCIRQNIHLVKNVILPMELIPARVVILSLIPQTIGLVMVAILSAINGNLGITVGWVLVALIVQIVFQLGLVWVLSGMGGVVPDLGYFINLIVLLLLFISPIAYRPEMVPGDFRFIVDLNPIYYMTELYRAGFISTYSVSPLVGVVAIGGSSLVFLFGAMFFRRFRRVLVDYE
jgi:lipopolysaccharide transport system permease protein